MLQLIGAQRVRVLFLGGEVIFGHRRPKKRYLLMALAIMVVAAAHNKVSAQQVDIVLDGWTGCERATNGRTYCVRPGTTNYQVVTEEFFQKFMSLKSGGQTQSSNDRAPQSNSKDWVPTGEVLVHVRKRSEIQNELRYYQVLVQRQTTKREAAVDTGERGEAQRTIDALSDRIEELRGALVKIENAIKGYGTPVKPEDIDKHSTARKISEISPRIPYYIPGTPEIGEFWLEPVVNETGGLIFNFQFVDAQSSAPNKVRAAVTMSVDELKRTQAALERSALNSERAHERKIRRNLRVRMDCFPIESCPEEGSKRDGFASTEVLFQVYENGSTAARIQKNKGLFEEGYNLSIPSARCLAAHIDYVLNAAQTEFEAGRQSDDEIKKLFR